MKIYTKVINKEIEDALNGNINKLWEVISTLEGDREFEKRLDMIKIGVKVKFDIRSVIEGMVEIKPAFKKVTIERKRDIDLTEYRDEIDIRKRMMKDILRDIYVDDFDNQAEPEVNGYE